MEIKKYSISLQKNIKILSDVVHELYKMIKLLENIRKNSKDTIQQDIKEQNLITGLSDNTKKIQNIKYLMDDFDLNNIKINLDIESFITVIKQAFDSYTVASSNKLENYVNTLNYVHKIHIHLNACLNVIIDVIDNKQYSLK